MWVAAILVCLSVGALGAEVVDDGQELVVLEVQTEPRGKRAAYPAPYPGPYAYPGAAEGSPSRATFGAAPGQYVVRTGDASQQTQPQEDLTPEFLQGLYQQLAAAQQQQQQQDAGQQSQPSQQPLIQQLVVARAPHVPQARVISHDSRYDQQPQTQVLQPRRQPATPRAPTEQQLLQQNFFQSNQLQGTLRSVSQARPNPTPPGASVFHDLNAAQANEIHQARLQASLAGQDPSYAQAQSSDEAYQQLRLAEQQHSEQQQLASLRAQSQQFYSQGPQAFPQPTAPAPAARRPAATSARPTYQPIADAPEQYLRETSPPAQHPPQHQAQQQAQQPLLVSLARGQLQVQASPEQNVYYTSSQPQPSPTPSAYLRPQQQSAESAAELTAYLRQQHLQQQQAASPSAAPQYIQQASPSAAPQYIQQASPSAAPQYIQQASPSAAPQYIQQASPSPSPAAFVQQYQRQPQPSANPAYIQQLRARPSPSASPSYIQQYRPQPSPVPSYIQLQQASPSASADPSAFLRQGQVNAAVSPNAYQQVESVTPSAPIYRPVQSTSDPTIYQSSERPQYQSPSAAPAFRRPQVVANPEFVQQRPATPSYYTGEQSDDPESQQFVSSLLSQQPGRGIFETANRNEAALRLLKSPTTAPPSRSSIYVSTSANRSPKSQVVEEQIEDDSRGNALPVVRLPTPKGQRPLTQSEYQALVAAGFNITPVDEKGVPHEVEASPSQQAFYQSTPKYQRSYVTASPPVNQLSQTTKLQRVPQEGYEAVVVPEEQPKVVRRRPGARRVRYQARPAYASEEQQEQPTYESFDSLPAAATDYSAKRRVRGRRPEVSSVEQES